MAKYKVEIKKLIEAVDSKYDHEEEVYTQIVEDLDTLAVINAVNNQLAGYSKEK